MVALVPDLFGAFYTLSEPGAPIPFLDVHVLEPDSLAVRSLPHGTANQVKGQRIRYWQNSSDGPD